MNKTFFAVLILLLLSAILKIIFTNSPQKERFADKSNLSSWIPNVLEQTEKSKMGNTLEEPYRVFGLFRIRSRKTNYSLQLRGGILEFGPETEKDLWTFFDKQLYSFYHGVYLVYNSINKTLQTASTPSKTHDWIFSRKGKLLWVNKSTKETDCISQNVLEDVEAEKKKCVDYMFYLEVAERPLVSLHEGASVVHSQIYYFNNPEKKVVIEKAPETKIFNDGHVYVFGYEPSFSLKKNVTKDTLRAELDVKRPTVLWVIMTARVSSNFENICKSMEVTKVKEGSSGKNPSNQTPGNQRKAEVKAGKENSKKQKTKSQCPAIIKNYGIKYHIQYPGLVRKVASQSAAEFGVEDPDTHKIYRCRDILTSPFYVKKFGKLI